MSIKKAYNSLVLKNYEMTEIETCNQDISFESKN